MDTTLISIILGTKKWREKKKKKKRRLQFTAAPSLLKVDFGDLKPPATSASRACFRATKIQAKRPCKLEDVQASSAELAY